MPAFPPERRARARPLSARFLRIRDVIEICGLSRASIYEAVKLGTFPPPIKITARASAWLKHEVDEWVEQRVAHSRRAVPVPRAQSEKR